MPSRRQTLIGAGASLILPPSVARARQHGGKGGGLVWRAMGQNMRQTVQPSFSGGSNWSSMCRSRHYSSYPFRYARFVIATFYNNPVGSGPIADIDLPNNYTFQLGVEYPFNNQFTGIPARNPALWSGSTSFTFVSGTGPEGYLVSDVYDFGQIVPAGTFFGLWTTIENAAGTGSASNTLPFQAVGSDGYQAGFTRYQGSTVATTSLVAANSALTSSSITPYGTTQSGANASVFTPCMMLIEVDATKPHVFSIGDSICYGIGEGGNGSSSYGDGLGSALGNAGYLARWIHEKLGHNNVNLGRGSDGYKYFSAANWQYRLRLLSLANPTHIVMQNIHNDLSAGSGVSTILANAEAAYAAVRAAAPNRPIIAATCTPDSGAITTPAWSASTTYAAGSIIAGPYICRSAGTSAAAGAGPAGHVTSLADGGVVWDYILAGAPGAQTASAGWGNATSHRGVWNDSYIRSSGSALGNAGWIDVNPALEYGYAAGNSASETSLWNSPRGIAYDLTIEGTHPNSYATYLAAGNMVATVGGTATPDPFLAC